MAARTIRLTLAYDGTAYVGWQRQPNGTSIQALLEQALEPIEGAAVAVTGSGRTDAGVHALAQVASCRLTHPIVTAALVRALNARLPDDVRVLDGAVAPDGFNARFSATGKSYRYRVLAQPLGDPFERHYTWHVPQALDLAAMEAALAPLRGEHDFATFQGAGSDAASTVRRIDEAAVEQELPLSGRETSVVALRFTATGVLRHMVRNLVGTVVEVGRGRRPPDSVGRALAARDRAAAGVTAPPQGLFLVRVTYGDAP
jgi:tRNA pseudouridine38-40 synthase